MVEGRRDLGLYAQPQPLDDVRTAITMERRASLRPTELRVLEVHAADGEEGDLFELVVELQGPLPDLRHWTGAVIERALHAPDGGTGVWEAEVIDVDPDHSTVFVQGQHPTEGIARVWPFDYLRALSKLIDEPRWAALHPDLGRNLAAAAGQARLSERPAAATHPAWGWSWCQVWGPPGTGKTWTLGRQVAALLDDPAERVLVVSTTNRATDAAALELGDALRERGRRLDGVKRFGRVATPGAFRARGLLGLLPDPSRVSAIEAANAAVDGARTPRERAEARRDLKTAWLGLPGLREAALDDRYRALVTTLHGATALLCDEGVLRHLEDGQAPFSTVVVDEAGLVGRAHAAAVGLLARRRVVLVGDPRQLSPIVRAARSLPRPVMRWLARSGLDHLDAEQPRPEVQLLDEQRRMHPAIGEAISGFQYAGKLRHHPSVRDRAWEGAGRLRHLPRATWYVLDDHPDLGAGGTSSRAGEGGHSRVRPATHAVLIALAQTEPALGSMRGLFVTPYVAQARLAARWLRELGWSGWGASTVHRQQGAEADVVVFDTVHASSTGWPPDEWCRLVNVGLSRARELVILVASRQELGQPWLRALRGSLAPRVMRRRGDRWEWSDAPRTPSEAPDLFRPDEPLAAEAPIAPLVSGSGLGAQIARRKQQRPILSSDQRRLVDRELSDAGPRLVRGVAGSGKTLVLAHWAARTLHGQGFASVVILFANSALRDLIARMLDEAWQAQHGAGGPAFPWDRVTLMHVLDLLDGLRGERGLPPPRDKWDYEAQATAILAAGPVEPRFPALFVDEAQDLGHAVLDLAIQLVEPLRDRKPVLIFYDNAQNLYRRSPPRWTDLGLDLRGRSDVMRESFRSCRPVVEVALNLVDRLGRGLMADADLRELRNDGLLVEGERGGERWWEAWFCADDGEAPELRVFEDAQGEQAFVVERVGALLQEGVRPGDVRILALSEPYREALARRLRAALPGVRVVTWSKRGLGDLDGALLVTTPHSFKGYDAEVVVVAGLERFGSSSVPDVAALYVALTRARTLLVATGCRAGVDGPGRQHIVDALGGVCAALRAGS